jgi:hypothetical protein
MPSAVVVKGVNEQAGVLLGVPACEVDLLAHPFVFEAAKDPLHHGVVPAVASPAHALSDAALFQSGDKGCAGVLAALVGVEEQASRCPSGPPGLLQRVEHQA